MNNEKDKELDDFFRKGLEDPVDHTGHEDEDWNALEAMLDKQKKRGAIVYWLPVLSAAAALLLLFLGWWAFQSKNIHQNQTLVKGSNNNHEQPNIDTNGRRIQQSPNQKLTIAPPMDYAQTSDNVKTRRNKKLLFTLSTDGASQPDDTGYLKKRMLYTPYSATNPAPFIEPGSITAPAIQSFAIKKDVYNPAANSSVSKGNKNIIKQRTAFHPQFALGVLAAPDINGVGSFQQGKVGTNVGLLFSATLLKKLTVSTGALYSVKPYTIAFGDYHTPYQFPVNPVNVTADCHMLDIPLNIGYQLYNKRQNKISIGTGLSSYIMLNENYKFNYADSYATGPSSFNVPNSSKYFFGVLNLNATYQHQLNSKVGISLQPYLKLPLTNLGYSQVRLQTTGVAVGLTWNLNSLSKQ